MPPKKAVTTGTRVSSRIKTTTATAATAASVAPTKAKAAAKRKADDDVEKPAAKRGRPAGTTRKIAVAKSTKATSAKAAPVKPAAKTSSESTTKAAASKAKVTTSAPPKAPAKSTSKAPANTATKAIKAATGAKKGPGRPKKSDTAAAKAIPKTTSRAAKRSSEDVEEPATRPATKARTPPSRVSINTAPTERLDVYVFGGGEMGELGLGTDKGTKNVKRPRINKFLNAEKVGVVQVATGGMHCVALTHDNKIITWGVNDQGACGRDTSWDGGLKDMDEKSDGSDDGEDDDNGLNPNEATPMAIPTDAFPEDVKFVQVAAGDSNAFALTEDGLVYGWGTFRSNEGILGFTKDIQVQRTPMLVPGLKKITYLACGANHVLALDVNGNVFAWGSGQQNQLGRRVVERTRMSGLTPREVGLPKKQVKLIACGGYHSFAIDKKDNVHAWGLNSYGECGVFANAGDDDAIVGVPTKIETLSGRHITCIKGGSHHSIAVTEAGDCLVWGRADGSQTGIDLDTISKDELIHDEHDRPRILKNPTKVPGITCKYATAESDHSIAITTDGQAYSWGFSVNYQTGQGTDEDIEEATLIDNTAIRGKQMNWAGAGGQYSILTGVANQAIDDGESAPAVNNVTTTSASKDRTSLNAHTNTKKSSSAERTSDVITNGNGNGDNGSPDKTTSVALTNGEKGSPNQASSGHITNGDTTSPSKSTSDPITNGDGNVDFAPTSPKELSSDIDDVEMTD